MGIYGHSCLFIKQDFVFMEISVIFAVFLDMMTTLLNANCANGHYFFYSCKFV